MSSRTRASSPGGRSNAQDIIILDRHVWILPSSAGNHYGTGGNQFYAMFGRLHVGGVGQWEQNIAEFSLNDNVPWGQVYNLNLEFEATVMIAQAMTDCDWWVLFGHEGNVSPPGVRKTIGFHVDGNAGVGDLYIRSADGAAASELDSGINLTHGIWYRLRARLNAGGPLQTWLNGVALPDKNTNLPVGSPPVATTGMIHQLLGNDANTYWLYRREHRIIYDFGL